MDLTSISLPVLGRILIGFYFAFFGFWNIYHWRPFMIVMIERNIPLPFLLLPIGICWQVITGVMIMFAIYTKLATILLIPFMLLGSYIFHAFWHFHGETRRLHLSIFIANFTISLGALLVLM